jgi:YegS/Rv2252/BmrU family lipid kinase
MALSSTQMFRNARLLFNPNAGKIRRTDRGVLKIALRHLRLEGHQVELVPSEGPGTAGVVARRVAKQGADLIIVAGGDGTINEVANGLVDMDVPLALLPGGTANVLASELGISDWTHALESFSESVIARVPVGCVEFPNGRTRHFLMMAGAGLDARMVAEVQPALKRTLGKLAYWVAGFSQVWRPLPQIEVQTNDRSFQTSFALLSKVRNYGGDLEIAPTVRLTDPDIEAVLFEGRLTLRYVSHLLRIVTRTLPNSGGVHILRGKEFNLVPLSRQHIHIQVDGEPVGYLPARVRLASSSLRFMLPASYLEKSKAMAA